MVDLELENANRRITETKGIFSVLEYVKDLSVSPYEAQYEYFLSKMNVRRRQLVCMPDGRTSLYMQKGAMQWFAGDVQCTTGVKGLGGLMGQMIRNIGSGESAIKPVYSGDGIVVLEPTYRHILLMEVGEWNGGLVAEDGMFLAAENTVTLRNVARSSISSAVAGGEGLFNMIMNGKGIVALESVVPREELLEITLQNDVLRIDGNLAVCWSGALEFTVERSSKTLIGSAMNGEGLVNVYRGTGKVLMSPVQSTVSSAQHEMAGGGK